MEMSSSIILERNVKIWTTAMSGNTCFKQEPCDVSFPPIKEEGKCELAVNGNVCFKQEPCLIFPTIKKEVKRELVMSGDVGFKQEPSQIVFPTIKKEVKCELLEKVKSELVSSLVSPHSRASVLCKEDVDDKTTIEECYTGTTGSKESQCNVEDGDVNDSPVVLYEDTAVDGRTSSSNVSLTKWSQCSKLKTPAGERGYGKFFFCSTCPARFIHEALLKRHMVKHTHVESFSCSICSARCTNKNDLSRHMWLHKGEKPYSCVACPSKFTNKYHLARHMHAVHTEEKPFSCAACPSKFKSKCHLARHMHTHTGEKLFSCVACPSRFPSKYRLDRHMHTVHTVVKPFSCTVCPAKFTQSDDLKRHLATTHMPRHMAVVSSDAQLLPLLQSVPSPPPPPPTVVVPRVWPGLQSYAQYVLVMLPK